MPARTALHRAPPIMAIMMAVAAGTLVSCTTPTPIVLSTEFSPPPGRPADRAKTGTNENCPVYLREIEDGRADRQSMGNIGDRPVRATDTAAWVKSGFVSLRRNPRIKLVDSQTAGTSAIGISAKIVQAYVMTITTSKSANVVLQVHYTTAAGPLDDHTYRGVDTGANWVNGTGETQGAFDRALDQIVQTMARDIVARCDAAPP